MSEQSRIVALIQRLLKVPAEPQAPAGDPGSVRVFRAGRGLYRYLLIQWALKQAGAVGGLAVGISILNRMPDFPYRTLVELGELLGILGFVCTMPVTFMMVHLDFTLRWYIVTDRSLRIREGLLEVREKTMSFANVQNISIRQGPLQRLFGIADVQVRTAGGGGGGSDDHAKGDDMHLGYFRGVDNAEEIRDAILASVRRLRDSGLGDPDSEPAALAEASIGVPAALPSADVVGAARELLEEARTLRKLTAATRA